MVSQRLLFYALFTTVSGFFFKSNRIDLTYGTRVPGDKLAMKDDIKVPSKFLRPVWALKTYNVPNKITYIRIFDNDERGSGARVKIKNGGVSFKFVSIYFKSARSNSLDFTVEVYAMTSGVARSSKALSGKPKKTSSQAPVGDTPTGEATAAEVPTGEVSAAEPSSGEAAAAEPAGSEAAVAEPSAGEAAAAEPSAGEAAAAEPSAGEAAAAEPSAGEAAAAEPSAGEAAAAEPPADKTAAAEPSAGDAATAETTASEGPAQ